MEQSAYEAIMIGVNVFVFIIALTAAILLMSNVIDMVNYANEQAIVGMNGTLAESVGVVTERTYTGAQMLNYYGKIKEDANIGYAFNVKLSELGEEKDIVTFVESQSIKNYLNEQFILQYKGLDASSNKDVYVFMEKPEDTEI